MGNKEVQDAIVEGLKSSVEDFTLLSISEQKNGNFDGLRLSGIAKYEGMNDRYYLDSFRLIITISLYRYVTLVFLTIVRNALIIFRKYWLL